MRVVIVVLLLFLNGAFAWWVAGAGAKQRWVATPTTHAGTQPLVLWAERGERVPAAARPPAVQLPVPEPVPEPVPGAEPPQVRERADTHRSKSGPPPQATEAASPSAPSIPRSRAPAAPETNGRHGMAEPKQPAGAGAISDETGPASSQPCYAVGPYASRAAAQGAADRVASRRLVLHIVRVPAEETRYWVYLPPADSRAAAFALERELRAKGVRDVQVLAGDGRANGVSLGLYRQAEAAERRQRQIQALGYRPQTDVLQQERPYYWVQAQAPQRQDGAQWWEGLLGDGRRVAQRSCADPVAN